MSFFANASTLSISSCSASASPSVTVALKPWLGHASASHPSQESRAHKDRDHRQVTQPSQLLPASRRSDRLSLLIATTGARHSAKLAKDITRSACAGLARSLICPRFGRNDKSLAAGIALNRERSRKSLDPRLDFDLPGFLSYKFVVDSPARHPLQYSQSSTSSLL